MDYYFNVKKKWISEVVYNFIGFSLLLSFSNDIEITSVADYTTPTTLGLSLSLDSDYVYGIDIYSVNLSNFALTSDIDFQAEPQINANENVAMQFDPETISFTKQKNISLNVDVTRYRFIIPSEPIYVLPITNSNISASLLNTLNIPLNTTFYILAGDISCGANVSTISEIEILGLYTEDYDFGVQIGSSTLFDFNITVVEYFNATALFNFSYITPTSFVLELVYKPTPTIIANVELTWVRRFMDLSGMVFSDLNGLTFEDLLYN